MKPYETQIDGLTVKLYIGLDGDYHVTREDSEMEHDHEIFDDFDQAKAFYDSLAENKLPEAFDDYNIIFSDDQDSSDKGFSQTLDYCRNYIKTYAGTNESYFADYKGGVVSIVNNKTGQVVESYSADNGKLISQNC